MLGDAPVQFDGRWDRIAEKINRETQKYGGIPNPFKQVHVDEFVGFLDGFLPAMRQMVGRVTAQGMGLPVSEEGQLASEEDARILYEFCGKHSGKIN